MKRRDIEDGCLVPAAGCLIVSLGYGIALAAAVVPVLLLIKWLFL